MSFSPWLHSRDILIAAAVYTAAALICTQLPLVHALGYESSFVFAFLGSLVAAFLTVSRLRRVYREPALDRGLAIAGTLRSLRQVAVANLALLVPPLVILLGNAFFVRNCAVVEGIAYFLLLPGVSVLFSTALAFFCVMHYTRPGLMFCLFMAATFCYALALGYFTPAIFSYNFFYGYFPGFTYDEALRLTGTLVSFRLITLGLAAVFIWLGHLLLTRTERTQTVTEKGTALLRLLIHPSQLGLTVIVVILAGLLYFFRCDLGYESTASYIRGQLGGMVKTEHFVIYYPQGVYTKEDLDRVVDEHEFRYYEILDLFSLPRFGTIESYIYPSAEAKRKLIGAGNTNIAKPWSRQVHVTAGSLYSTLEHELVHVIASRFGRPIIKASFSMGLTEGLAMAVEYDWGTRTLHQYAAAMRQMGLAPDITTLMTPAGFMTQSSSVSYVLAGSFCRFLMDRYGTRRLLQVYGSENYEEQYGRPLGLLIAEWDEYLDRIDLDAADIAAAGVFFRQPSIFRKTCPRVVGERNISAARAMAGGAYAVAESLYAVSYDEGRGYEALSGLVTAALRRGAYDSVVTVLDRVAASDPHPERYMPLSLQRGDALWAKGDRADAFDLYHALRGVDLMDAYTEASSVRLLAIQDSLQEGFLRYFLTAGPDSVRVPILDSLLAIAPDHRLLHYLHGRAALRNQRFKEAIDELSAITMDEEDPVLEAFRYTSIGIASYYTGDYDRARASFWLSLNWDDSDVAEHAVNTWVERCEWRGGGNSTSRQ